MSTLIAGGCTGGGDAYRGPVEADRVAADGSGTFVVGGTTVAFEAGDATPRARVRIQSFAPSAPPPPAGVVPLSPPIDVSVDGEARGRVTITYPEALSSNEAGDLQMYIVANDRTTWEAVPVTIETVGDRTEVTAMWPHFSSGFLGLPSVIESVASQTWSTTISAVSGTASAVSGEWTNTVTLVSDLAGDLKHRAQDLALSMSGGTPDPPACDEIDDAVRMVGFNADGSVEGQSGNSSRVTLEGCAEAQTDDQRSRGVHILKIRNHQAFPMVLELPDDMTVRPDIKVSDSVTNIIAKGILLLHNAHDHRAYIDAGGEIEVIYRPSGVPSEIVTGFPSAAYYIVDTAVVAATVFSLGKSAEAMRGAQSVIRSASAELETASSFEAAMISRWGGELHRAERTATIQKAMGGAEAAGKFFDLWDMVGCVTPAVNAQSGSLGSWDALNHLSESKWNLLTGDCFADLLAPLGLNPRQTASAIAGAFKDFSSLITNALAFAAQKISSGRIDVVNAGLKVFAPVQAPPEDDQGYGAVRLGMGLGELLRTGEVGTPEPSSPGACVFYPIKGTEGGAVYNPVSSQVSNILFNDSMKTAKGIRVGSTIRELRTAYPGIHLATGLDGGFGDLSTGPMTELYVQVSTAEVVLLVLQTTDQGCAS